jgi:hypothetical protein
MENNQEHRIDKIFRETFENQEITPPSDAWMSIHTYTIGQEQKKPKVWLRYASLAMALLLVSGLGFWYFANNQTFDTPVAGLPTSPLVRKHTQKSILPTTGNIVANVSPPSIVHKHIPTLLTPEVDWSGDQPRDESADIAHSKNTETLLSQELLVENTNNGESLSYFNGFQTENITTKPLILNNLSDKMQKESERKLLVLEENFVHKKVVYKADTVVFGKRFSLKHPILNFRLGMFNTSVSINAREGGNNPFNSDVINPNSVYAFSGIIGIAWKLNHKSRISLNAKFISYSAINAQSKSGAAYIDPLSPTNKPTGTFKYNASKDVYEYLTPFGYVTQPVDPKSSATPKDFDVWLSGRITNLQIGLNYEHDLIAFRNKKGGIPAMEIYGLVGLNIQKIRKYSYSYSLFKNYDPKDNVIFYAPTNQPIYTQSSLENGSPIVFGYNTGLGIRFQLSKGFGLNISGNYESNINSWVKDLPFTTRLSVLSVEGGFFVNL